MRDGESRFPASHYNNHCTYTVPLTVSHTVYVGHVSVGSFDNLQLGGERSLWGVRYGQHSRHNTFHKHRVGSVPFLKLRLCLCSALEGRGGVGQRERGFEKEGGGS